MEPVVLSDGRFEYRFVTHSQKEGNRAARMFDKEKGTITWIDRELRPDDVFYDIGANIGTFTLFAGKRLGASGRLIAFEPHIPNANSLIENIFLNGLERRVQLVTAALTNASGYNRFNYFSMVAGGSTSQYGRHEYEGESFTPEFVEIKHGCTVDALVAAGVIPAPNVIKIDVDGLDFQVLAGMQALLASPQRPRSIQIELGTDSMPKILPFCERLGYVIKERHWSQAGLDWIAQGKVPQEYPHYGIFYHPDAR